MLGCFALTFSRGGFIAFFVCLVWLAFYRSKKIFLLVLPIALILMLFPYRSYFNRAYIIQAVDPTVHRRLLIWEGAVNMIKDRPLVGHGLNTYNATYPEYKPEELTTNPYAHNSYLQMLAEIDRQLEKTEIVKVKVLRSALTDEKVETIASEIAQSTESMLIETRGHTIILYRKKNGN